jgi:hypothetical protein
MVFIARKRSDQTVDEFVLNGRRGMADMLGGLRTYAFRIARQSACTAQPLRFSNRGTLRAKANVSATAVGLSSPLRTLKKR